MQADRNKEGFAWQGWCDGSARPNPGQMAIGGVLRGPNTQAEITFSTRLSHAGCNNEAEALALRQLLLLAREQGITRLLVWSDSSVIVHAATSSNDERFLRLAALFAEIRQIMSHFAQIELRWLPQHRNQLADKLSRQALGLGERPAPRPAKRRRH